MKWYWWILIIIILIPLAAWLLLYSIAQGFAQNFNLGGNGQLMANPSVSTM